MALVEAGMRLLARMDYDALSIKRIAQESGVSIETFYERYSNKESYLYRIIAEGFRRMADDASRALDRSDRPNESRKSKVERIVTHIVTEMTGLRAAGIIRAAMKLATAKPLTLELFQDYRKTVTEIAVNMLATKSHRSWSGSVRIGMQIVFATLTDAILQKHPGPLRAGSTRMAEALANILAGYIGEGQSRSWAGAESDGEDDPAPDADFGSETPPELEDGEIAIFDPDLRTFVGRQSGLRQKQRNRRKGIKASDADVVTRVAEKKLPNINPSIPAAAKSAASPDQKKQPSNPTRRRHRTV